MALLLPSTFALEPATALIMLAGIYYGAMYGGSTTSILVNVPGEAASVVTAIDGYQMTKKGRAGAALTVAGVGSFVAGSLGVVGIVLASAWLAEQALRFGPPEYFAMALAGLLLLSRLSGGSVLRSCWWRSASPWARWAWSRSRRSGASPSARPSSRRASSWSR
jgi:putative tricarboxylic transport membrane protein